MRGAAAIINVSTVRRAADWYDFRAKLGQCPRAGLVARAVRTVEYDLVAFESQVFRKCCSGELLIL